MFGFGKKKKMITVQLTEEELAFLQSNMTPAQLKEFQKIQKNARSDDFSDGFLMGYIVGED